MKVARLIVGKRIWMKFRLMQGVFLFLQIERYSTQREFQLPWWGTFSFVFFSFGCNTIHHCNIVMSDADVYIGGVACNFPFHPPVTPGVKPSPASVSRPCDGCLPGHLRIAFIGQQYIEEVSTMPSMSEVPGWSEWSRPESWKSFSMRASMTWISGVCFFSCPSLLE